MKDFNQTWHILLNRQVEEEAATKEGSATRTKAVRFPSKLMIHTKKPKLKAKSKWRTYILRTSRVRMRSKSTGFRKASMQCKGTSTSSCNSCHRRICGRREIPSVHVWIFFDKLFKRILCSDWCNILFIKIKESDYIVKHWSQGDLWKFCHKQLQSIDRQLDKSSVGIGEFIDNAGENQVATEETFFFWSP